MRHLIVLSVECLRSDALDAHASAVPHLRALAARGTVFRDCIAPAVVTTAAQAAILTGQLPMRNGVRIHFPAFLRPGTKTLFQHLGARGFESVAHADFVNDLEMTGVLAGAAAVPSVSRALTAVARSRARRKRTALFLQMGVLHRRAAERRRTVTDYRAALRRFDRKLGALLRELERRRWLEDSVLFLVGAHGEGHVRGRGFGHGTGVPQDAIQVPWIVAGVGGPKRTIAHALVSTVDLAPTALGALGIRASAKLFDGKDRVPLIRGRAGSSRAAVGYSEAWTYPPGYFRALAIAYRGMGRAGGWRGFSGAHREVLLCERTLRSGRLKWSVAIADGRARARVTDAVSDPTDERNLIHLKTPEGRRARNAAARLGALLERLDRATRANDPVPPRQVVLRFPLHAQAVKEGGAR